MIYAMKQIRKLDASMIAPRHGSIFSVPGDIKTVILSLKNPQRIPGGGPCAGTDAHV
jgi:hypothetical protein